MPRGTETLTDVEQWFRKQVALLWPAALGSLSLRRSPCVREHCEACRSGEQHASHVLYGRIKGRRFAIYIPDELVRRYSPVSTTVVSFRSCCIRAPCAIPKPEASKGENHFKRSKNDTSADPQINFADIEFLTQGIDLDRFSKGCSTSSTISRRSGAGAPRSSET